MPSHVANTGVRAARRLRSDTGLALSKPLTDLLRLAEEGAGLPIVVLDLDPSISGAYVKRGVRAIAFVNAADGPHGRRRFTLAHELGHHVLGHQRSSIDLTESWSGAHDPLEIAANAFAAELLMPAPAIRLWLRENGQDERSDVATVVRCAADFGVSAPMALLRMREIGFARAMDRAELLEQAISDSDHKAVERDLNVTALDARFEEACATPPRFSPLLRGSAFLAYQRGDVSAAELAARLRIPVDDLVAATRSV